MHTSFRKAVNCFILDGPFYVDFQLEIKLVSPKIHDNSDILPYFQDPNVSFEVVLAYSYVVTRKKPTEYLDWYRPGKATGSSFERAPRERSS
jgi:hypothetical protein